MWLLTPDWLRGSSFFLFFFFCFGRLFCFRVWFKQCKLRSGEQSFLGDKYVCWDTDRKRSRWKEWMNGER